MKMQPLKSFLLNLKNNNFEIKTVYDIGACKGKWSADIQSSVLPDSAFFLFEANPAYDTILKNTGFAYFNTVLSNPGREFVNFYNGTDTGDSYYKETTKIYDQTTSVSLPCTTLDNLINTHSLPVPDFIKIDTQGSELDILSGAGSIINDVKIVYCECPIVQYNLGSPNIQEYLDFFKNLNFVPVTILENHYMENILVQIDIMFMRYDIKNKFLGATENVRPFIK
jgi:FkbM family methyltransferase